MITTKKDVGYLHLCRQSEGSETGVEGEREGTNKEGKKGGCLKKGRSVHLKKMGALDP